MCIRDSPETIDVCIGCYEGLQMVGSVDITQTREFNFGPSNESENIKSTDANNDATGDVQCSWCNKPQSEVKRLVSQNKIHVCNECIGLCVDVLSAEFGESWRKS